MTHDEPELTEYAPLAELADAPHSKCGAGNGIRVRVPGGAQGVGVKAYESFMCSRRARAQGQPMTGGYLAQGCTCTHPSTPKREGHIMEENETPGVAAPEVTTVPIEDYGRGSYKLRALVEQLQAVDPRLKSVNLLL